MDQTNKVGDHLLKPGSRTHKHSSLNKIIPFLKKLPLKDSPQPHSPYSSGQRHLLIVNGSDCVLFLLLRATREARNTDLQVVITHASHVGNQHSFGFSQRMNEMPRTQFGDARMDLLSLVI